jgi:Pentapeptide repeats (8 copies)
MRLSKWDERLASSCSVVHNPPYEEERRMDQEQQQSKQTSEEKPETAEGRLLKGLGIDPDKWTVGDRWLALLVIGAGLPVLIIGICGYLFGWEWTGFHGPEQRMFWDWLDLLILPAVVALGGYLFTRAVNLRAQDIAKKQRNVDREIADQRMKLDRKIVQERAETDRQIADQHRQDNILHLYLDQIGQLMLDNDRPLRQSKFLVSGDTEGNDVSTLARARTLTVLTRLDGGRKASVVQFLKEAGLISKGELVVSLYGADLSGANLSEVPNLSKADLSNAILSGANLSGDFLIDADLSNADLSGANVSPEQLAQAYSLEGATLPDEQILKSDDNPNGRADR